MWLFTRGYPINFPFLHTIFSGEMWFGYIAQVEVVNGGILRDGKVGPARTTLSHSDAAFGGSGMMGDTDGCVMMLGVLMGIDICLIYVWYMFDICVCVFDICLIYVWYVWYMFDICLIYVWPWFNHHESFNKLGVWMCWNMVFLS